MSFEARDGEMIEPEVPEGYVLVSLEELCDVIAWVELDEYLSDYDDIKPSVEGLRLAARLAQEQHR